MKIKFWGLAFVLGSLLCGASFAETKSKKELARQAVSPNPQESAAAIRNLRSMGKEGLDALFETYAGDIRQYSENGVKSENWEQIALALDNVAMQKNAYASHLFWLTDLEEAQKQAKAENKPILSLRLLGNLHEEFSCANSRFFRAVLYPNRQISEYLRKNYILHWKSVRPAPRITIDFGDGRKIERTVTGNSIHYVLDENGEVVNALPGLYSPNRFYQFLNNSDLWLKQAKDFEAGKIPVITDVKIENKRNAYLKDMRSREYAGLRQQINRAVNSFGINFDTTAPAKRRFEEMPTAIEVAPRAMTKMVTEINFLKDMTPDVARYGNEQIGLEQWQKLADTRKNFDKLDAGSLAFIRRQVSNTGLSETQFTSLSEKLEGLIRLDSVRNDFLFRPTLLVWLNKGLDKDVEKLNEKVYAELFLTPNEDKWLGLYAPEVYTALEGNGITSRR